jgi:hypothetical protein
MVERRSRTSRLALEFEFKAPRLCKQDCEPSSYFCLIFVMADYIMQWVTMIPFQTEHDHTPLAPPMTLLDSGWRVF